MNGKKMIYNKYNCEELNVIELIKFCYGYFCIDLTRKIYLLYPKLRVGTGNSNFRMVLCRNETFFPNCIYQLTLYGCNLFNNCEENFSCIPQSVRYLILISVHIRSEQINFLLKHLKNIKKIHFQKVTSTSKENLELIMKNKRLKKIALVECEITNEWSNYVLQNCKLKSETKIYKVNLKKNPLSTKGLIYLECNEFLKLINLNYTKIDDDVITVFKSCKQLRHLYIEFTDISENGLREIFGIRNLRTIVYSPSLNILPMEKKNEIFKLAIEELSPPPLLEALCVRFLRQISYPTIKMISGFIFLSDVILTSCNLTDDRVLSIVQLKSLRKLSVSKNRKLTVKTVEYISTNTNIYYLNYSFNRVSEIVEPNEDYDNCITDDENREYGNINPTRNIDYQKKMERKIVKIVSYLFKIFEMKNLKRLYLNGCKIDQNSLSHISENLVFLSLKFCNLSQMAIDFISSRTNVVELLLQ